MGKGGEEGRTIFGGREEEEEEEKEEEEGEEEEEDAAIKKGEWEKEKEEYRSRRAVTFSFDIVANKEGREEGRKGRGQRRRKSSKRSENFPLPGSTWRDRLYCGGGRTVKKDSEREIFILLGLRLVGRMGKRWKVILCAASSPSVRTNRMFSIRGTVNLRTITNPDVQRRLSSYQSGVTYYSIVSRLSRIFSADQQLIAISRFRCTKRMSDSRRRI